MSMIHWKNDYSINIREMDEQHKKWVGFINDLYEAKLDKKDIIFELLDDVLDYTETHFTKEEELMKQHGFDEYAEHKAIHDSLIKEVSALYKSSGATSEELPTKVLRLLNNWLVDHILKVDKKYGVYLNSKGIT